MPDIHIANDLPSWIRMAVRFISGSAENSLEHNGRFIMALSGGSTPQPIYEALPDEWSQRGLDWQRIHIIWGDERCVPLDHSQSNYRMAAEAFLNRIEIPEKNIHPMSCGDDPAASAAAYAAMLRALYPGQKWPTIDLLLLGLGSDGHTASLFPDTPALKQRSRWVVSNESQSLDKPRLTLTYPAINAARKIAFLVAGSDKAAMVKRVLFSDERQPAVPAQAVQPSDGELHWLLDAGAASEIPSNI